jgi:acetyltransferase-like isoleucine patch superfamily enzyme
LALLNTTNEFNDFFLDTRSSIGPGCVVWGGTYIREFVEVGVDTTIGRNVYIGPQVNIGKNCKIQNNALIYEPSSIGDYVFIGPGVILTNDKSPRAVNLDLSPKTSADWNSVGVKIKEGASIGAGSICIGPIEIGRWALIGAGSVVTRDVPDFALMVGNPARRIGWVGRNGKKLEAISNILYRCPQSQEVYVQESEDSLVLQMSERKAPE